MMKVMSGVKEAKLSAKIIKADGTVVELGTISEYKEKKSLLNRLTGLFSNK